MFGKFCKGYFENFKTRENPFNIIKAHTIYNNPVGTGRPGDVLN